MLTPTHAWRILCRRTGGTISRTTFYRWINSGRVGAVRVGFRFLVPLPMLEEVIKKCLDGERI
jgi:excisionase family DNA binding protein